MWQLIAIVLIAIIGFYLGAIYLTVVAWLNAVGHLFRGHFIRASIWFSIGVGMLLWWNGTETIPHPWDVDAWLKGSAWVVGLGALATFVRWRKKQAMQTIPTMPAWPTPADAVGNTAPIIEVEYKRLPN